MNGWQKIKSKGNRLPLICAAAIAAVLAITALILLLIPKDKKEPDVSDGRPEIEQTRGVYVAAVYNLNFPSKPDLTAEELKGELDAIVKNAADAGLNTIYFQVRPSCDALYRSDIFPVSEFLSSTGELPLDCLEYLIQKCHAENMAVYAWVNPLRVSVSKQQTSELSPSCPAASLGKYVVNYNGTLYFDAGSSEVRELVCEGIRELCENYVLDGIVFDDYFYPYKAYETNPDGTKSVIAFDDEETYKEFGDGFSSVDDFRRNNINLLVEASYNTVKSSDERCMFGVACFGIWKNGGGGAEGSLTRGTESYSEIYCDSVSWVDGGYIDFLAPQIYWSMDNPAASYKVISKWWDARISEAASAGADSDKGRRVKLLISHAAYKYANDFESGEMTSQLDWASELENYGGSVFYSYAALKDNTNGFTDEIKAYYLSADAQNTQEQEDNRGNAE